MKVAVSIFLLFAFALTATAQGDTAFHLIKSYKGEISDAAIDNLDNVYILTATDQLKKYNSNGDSLAVYNNVRRFGRVSTLDVSNPLKVLMYYKDFSSIVILDRLLGVRSTIDLRKRNMLQVTAIGQSYDNNIWVFDAYDYKLKKIDEDGKILLETPDLRMVFNQAVAPQQIIDNNKQVYLYDTASGVFVFDNYGSFKRKLPITGWSNISITDKQVVGVGGESVQAYNITSLIESQYKFPGSFTPYYRYHISSNKLLALSKEGLHIYRY